MTHHLLVHLLSRTFLLALVVSVAGTALAAEPKRGGALRVAYGNEIANLDFHTAPGYEMMWVAMNVGCGLIRGSSRTSRPVAPALAVASTLLDTWPSVLASRTSRRTCPRSAAVSTPIYASRLHG